MTPGKRIRKHWTPPGADGTPSPGSPCVFSVCGVEFTCVLADHTVLSGARSRPLPTLHIYPNVQMWGSHLPAPHSPARTPRSLHQDWGGAVPGPCTPSRCPLEADAPPPGSPHRPPFWTLQHGSPARAPHCSCPQAHSPWAAATSLFPPEATGNRGHHMANEAARTKRRPTGLSARPTEREADRAPAEHATSACACQNAGRVLAVQATALVTPGGRDGRTGERSLPRAA